MTSREPIIICVTGAHSAAGKTSLCTILLREFSGFGAIKYTKTPRYPSLIDDISILGQRGKDTALFLESGAPRVFWIRSPYDGLRELLDSAVNRMRDLRGIIIEGNSPVDFLKPHLIIFITKPDGDMKPSAVKVAQMADIAVINAGEKAGGPQRLSAFAQDRCKVFRIDLLHGKGQLSEFFCVVKKRIDRESHQGNCNG